MLENAEQNDIIYIILTVRRDAWITAVPTVDSRTIPLGEQLGAISLSSGRTAKVSCSRAMAFLNVARHERSSRMMKTMV